MSEMSKAKKIAITGGIGSGKSTLTNILKEMGYPVFDADQCVAELYINDSELIEHFKQLFPEVVDQNGINKDKLRHYLIKHPYALKNVEHHVHPRVLNEFTKFVQNSSSEIVFGEIPLLFEANWQEHFDEVWCVYASQDTIIERLTNKRSLSKETIQSMLNWQMNPQKKCALSTFVLYNDKEIDYLKQQVIQRLKS